MSWYGFIQKKYKNENCYLSITRPLLTFENVFTHQTYDLNFSIILQLF